MPEWAPYRVKVKTFVATVTQQNPKAHDALDPSPPTLCNICMCEGWECEVKSGIMLARCYLLAEDWDSLYSLVPILK